MYSDQCKNNTESYQCKKYLNSLFFNQDFNAIDYGYIQKKENLLKFIIKNLNIISRDNPDLINEFIFSKFFNPNLFISVIDFLVAEDTSTIQPNTQLLNLILHQLNL